MQGNCISLSCHRALDARSLKLQNRVIARSSRRGNLGWKILPPHFSTHLRKSFGEAKQGRNITTKDLFHFLQAQACLPADREAIQETFAASSDSIAPNVRIKHLMCLWVFVRTAERRMFPERSSPLYWFGSLAAKNCQIKMQQKRSSSTMEAKDPRLACRQTGKTFGICLYWDDVVGIMEEQWSKEKFLQTNFNVFSFLLTYFDMITRHWRFDAFFFFDTESIGDDAAWKSYSFDVVLGA